MKKWFIWAALALGLPLAACQSAGAPPTAEIIPTLIDLEAIATANAATAAALAAESALRPTLPPTWTPSPPAAATSAALPSPTATPARDLGTLYFIFNGDSIVQLKADGSFEQIILVGGAPSHLALSPDGSLLAYVAQGNGSAREVFIASLDGAYTQQISCLGFAYVVEPAWSPDGAALAFAAAPVEGAPLGVYTAAIAGSNACPSGNGQRQLAALEAAQLADLGWDPGGDWLYFAATAIYSLSTVDGRLLALTIPSGFGPDFSPALNFQTRRLTYLKTEREARTGRTGGTVYELETAQMDSAPRELRGAPYFARSLRWSPDGDWLLVAGEREVWVQGRRTGTALQLVAGGNFFPQPVFSPDAALVAYVDGGRDAVTVPQVFVVSRQGEDRRQLTFHQEGTISDLLWTPR